MTKKLQRMTPQSYLFQSYLNEVEGIGAFGQPMLHSMISLKRDTGPFKGTFFSVDADII
jgi:hypothetical protein